ncbi:MAG: L-lactate dehydrogenase [Lachnospiraceae bacterium]|nr:L-lactate dehydrogenase [Lachnospiraceae bacterium]
MNTIGIVGTGHVGAHCAYALAIQGLADALILLDTDEKKLRAEVQDLRDSTFYYPHRADIRPGTYSDLRDCDLVVISVGGITEDENRLSELRQSDAIIEECVPRIVEAGFSGIFLVITNPCDIMAARVRELSGFAPSRVIGTGTGLDSARLKEVLARELGVSHKSLECFTIGEHGDSQIAPWSCFRIGGQSLERLAAVRPEVYKKLDRAAVLQEVKRAGWVVFAGKHATEYGIASTLAALVRCILHDEKQVLPASVWLNGTYGEFGIYAGMLCRVGRQGVEEVYELPLTEEERRGFQDSCRIIRENLAALENS